MLLAVEGIDVFIELAAIKVTLDRAEVLKGLAEGFDILNRWNWGSDDSGQEAEQDHGSGGKKDGWTEEHLECACSFLESAREGEGGDSVRLLLVCVEEMRRRSVL